MMGLEGEISIFPFAVEKQSWACCCVYLLNFKGLNEIFASYIVATDFVGHFEDIAPLVFLNQIVIQSLSNMQM